MLFGRGLVSPDKIVLIDSAGIKPKRSMKYYLKVGFFKTGKMILNLLPNSKELQDKLRGKVGSSDYKASPVVLKDTMKIILNEDVKELLPNIKVPTLLIWGSLDTATPISDAKTIEKLIDTFETEMNILHKLSQDDIEAVVGEKIAQNIVNAREGNMTVESGGGGNYGKITAS